MKEKLIEWYTVAIYIFAFVSSVYCTNLLIKKILNSNTEYITASFFICVFLLGFLINLKGKDE